MKRDIEIVTHKEIDKIIKNFQRPTFHYKLICQNKERNTIDVLTGRKSVLRKEAKEEFVRYCLVMEQKVGSVSKVSQAVGHEE